MKNKIAFNPNYVLKPDEGRVLLLARYLGRTLPDVSDSFEAFIHPIHAMILSFFQGENVEEAIKTASATLKLPSEQIENLINKLINNQTFLQVKSANGISTFPPNTLVEVQEEPVYKYNYKDFRYTKLDLINKRHATPTRLTLMVNNKCATNCFYCYADRNNPIDCQIPFSRIKELIAEAKKLNVITFDVMGGEFFLYKNWYEVIEELHKNGFHPYLSTKIPLDEDTIKKLSLLGIKDLQVSLDSLIPENLMEILKVNENYTEKIKNTLLLLKKYEINTFIHTVLNRKNSTVEDMSSIYGFISNLSNISEWKIDTAGSSLYIKESYENIKPEKSQVESIAVYIDSLKEVEFFIRAPRPQINNEVINKSAEPVIDFFNRGFCSGNFSSLYILPDGKVTMCEELYWKKRFILGDVISSSIQEVWNSVSARELFYLRKEDFPTDSLCSSCEDFISCRSLKQVCYKEIIKKFGDEKWYYPDPNCPKLIS